MFKQEIEKINWKVSNVLRVSKQISHLFECQTRGMSKDRVVEFLEKNKFDGRIKNICFYSDQEKNICIVTGKNEDVFRIEFTDE